MPSFRFPLLALALQATLVLHHANRADARMRRLHLEEDVSRKQRYSYLHSSSA
jgi:hypothetical protein